MSQMHQSAAGSTCPNPACEEPVESGDRFCGGCGYALSRVRTPAVDRPTVPINGVRGPVSAAPDHDAPDRGASPGAAPPPPPGAPGTPATGSVPPPDPRAGASQGGPAKQHGAQAGPDGTPAASVEWPAAPGTGAAEPPGPVHLPTDLPGTDAYGAQLPTQQQPEPHRAEQQPQSPAAEQPAPAGHQTPPAPLPPPFVAPAPASAASPPAAGPAAPGAPAQPTPTVSDTDYRLAAPRPPADHPLRDDSPSDGAPPQSADPRTDPRTVAPNALPAPAADAKLCVFCTTGRVDQDEYCEHCGKAQPRERDHMEQELGAVAAVSDRGLRHHRNEDAFAVVLDRAAGRRARRGRRRLRRGLLGDPARRRVGGGVPCRRRVPARRPAARHPPAAGDARRDHRRLRTRSTPWPPEPAERRAARTRTPPPAPSSARSSPRTC